MLAKRQVQCINAQTLGKPAALLLLAPVDLSKNLGQVDSSHQKYGQPTDRTVQPLAASVPCFHPSL